MKNNIYSQLIGNEQFFRLSPRQKEDLQFFEERYRERMREIGDAYEEKIRVAKTECYNWAYHSESEDVKTWEEQQEILIKERDEKIENLNDCLSIIRNKVAREAYDKVCSSSQKWANETDSLRQFDEFLLEWRSGKCNHRVSWSWENSWEKKRMKEGLSYFESNRNLFNHSILRRIYFDKSREKYLKLLNCSREEILKNCQNFEESLESFKALKRQFEFQEIEQEFCPNFIRRTLLPLLVFLEALEKDEMLENLRLDFENSNNLEKVFMFYVNLWDNYEKFQDSVISLSGVMSVAHLNALVFSCEEIGENIFRGEENLTKTVYKTRERIVNEKERVLWTLNTVFKN